MSAVNKRKENKKKPGHYVITKLCSKYINLWVNYPTIEEDISSLEHVSFLDKF